MLPVHDIFLPAEISQSHANTMAMGADRCAGKLSGRGPWSATSPRSARTQAFTAVQAYVSVAGE